MIILCGLQKLYLKLDFFFRKKKVRGASEGAGDYDALVAVGASTAYYTWDPGEAGTSPGGAHASCTLLPDDAWEGEEVPCDPADRNAASSSAVAGRSFAWAEPLATDEGASGDDTSVAAAAVAVPSSSSL